MKSTVCASLLAGAAGHGAMNTPKPRNQGAGSVTDIKENPGCAGDACLWYSVGCFIGCDACTGIGKELYPSPGCDNPMEPTNNDPATRTWDPHGKSPSGDFTKYNPWRAPGHAPVLDPCGEASGYLVSGYDVPTGYKQNDLGSKVLPEGVPTFWKAGGVAEVAWSMAAQHGGGYSYRLCPKSELLTEKCFQAGHLSFVGNTTIRYDDGSRESFEIETVTAEFDGKQWRTQPVPGCNCDVGGGCGSKSEDKLSHMHLESLPPRARIPYDSEGAGNKHCPTGTMFPARWEDGAGEGGAYAPGYGKLDQGYSFVDHVEVPIEPGEYVLSWRWDCEETAQVWNSCADIVITDGPLPPPAPPTPTPPPAPTPPPSGTCASRDPSKKFDCFYEGCKTGTSKSCSECCDGCHLESDPSKGTYCMEDKEEFV